MKWILVAVGLWSDGSYTIAGVASYETKEECKIRPMETYEQAGQATLYRSYICVPSDTWLAFTQKGIR